MYCSLDLSYLWTSSVQSDSLSTLRINEASTGAGNNTFTNFQMNKSEEITVGTNNDLEHLFFPVVISVIGITAIGRVLAASQLSENLEENNKINVMAAGLISLMLELTAICLFGVSIGFYTMLYFKKPVLILIGLSLVFQTDHG